MLQFNFPGRNLLLWCKINCNPSFSVFFILFFWRFFFWTRLNHVAMMGMTQLQRVRSAGKTCQAARSKLCCCTRFFLVRYVTLLIPGACCLLKLSYLRVCLCRVEEKYDTPNEKWRFFCFFSLQPIFVRGWNASLKLPPLKGRRWNVFFPSKEFPLLAAFLRFFSVLLTGCPLL